MLKNHKKHSIYLIIYLVQKVNICFIHFQDVKFWKHQFELLLTDIRDKKREEEKKASEAKQGSNDKENSKTNEKTAPSLTTGELKFY